MYLGVKAEIKADSFLEDTINKSCEFTLVLKDNPLNDFIQLPSNL